MALLEKLKGEPAKTPVPGAVQSRIESAEHKTGSPEGLPVKRYEALAAR